VKSLAKGKIVGKIERKKGYWYYVDAEGNIRETKPKRKKKREGKRKRKSYRYLIYAPKQKDTPLARGNSMESVYRRARRLSWTYGYVAVWDNKEGRWISLPELKEKLQRKKKGG